MNSNANGFLSTFSIFAKVYQAVKIYTKAVPEVNYQDLERQFRAAKFNIYLIAVVCVFVSTPIKQG